MLKKTGVKIILIIVLLLSVVVATLVMHINWQKAKQTTELMELLFGDANRRMDVELQIEIEEEQYEFKTELYSLIHNDSSVLVVGETQSRIYFYNNVFYLENGRAYGLVDSSKNGLMQPGIFAGLYQLTEISKQEDQYEVKFQTKTQDETVIYVTAVLHNIKEIEPEEILIPDVVQSALDYTDKDDVQVFGEDMYRLILAWMEFQSREERIGTVTLDVSCGPVSFDTTLAWNADKIGSTEISNPDEVATLPALVYTILLEGEYSCEKTKKGYVYSLELEDEATQKLAEMIAPEIVTQVVDLQKGDVYITIKGNELDMIEVDIEGLVNLLVAKLPAKVYAKFRF